MHTAIVVAVSAAVGYGLGVWSSSDFRSEIVTIHQKLNSILAAVKK